MPALPLTTSCSLTAPSLTASVPLTGALSLGTRVGAPTVLVGTGICNASLIGGGGRGCCTVAAAAELHNKPIADSKSTVATANCNAIQRIGFMASFLSVGLYV